MHRAPWPDAALLVQAFGAAEPAILDAVSAVLMEVRKAKSEQRQSQRSAVKLLVVEDLEERLAELRQGQSDLCRAGSIEDLELRAAPARKVSVELAQV